jgi:hypothetical protein
MASFLKYVDLYLTSEWGRFYVGHPVLAQCKLKERVDRLEDQNDRVIL